MSLSPSRRSRGSSPGAGGPSPAVKPAARCGFLRRPHLGHAWAPTSSLSDPVHSVASPGPGWADPCAPGPRERPAKSGWNGRRGDFEGRAPCWRRRWGPCAALEMDPETSGLAAGSLGCPPRSRAPFRPKSYLVPDAELRAAVSPKFKQ